MRRSEEPSKRQIRHACRKPRLSRAGAPVLRWGQPSNRLLGCGDAAPRHRLEKRGTSSTRIVARIAHPGDMGPLRIFAVLAVCDLEGVRVVFGESPLEV